jgi:hypothetical protein
MECSKFLVFYRFNKAKNTPLKIYRNKNHHGAKITTFQLNMIGHQNGITSTQTLFLQQEKRQTHQTHL